MKINAQSMLDEVARTTSELAKRVVVLAGEKGGLEEEVARLAGIVAERDTTIAGLTARVAELEKG